MPDPAPGQAPSPPFSAEELQRLFDAAPIGIFHTAVDGRLLAVNAEGARMCGYPSPREMVAAVGDVARQLFVEPERRRAYLAAVAQAFPGFIQVENTYRRRDGSTFLALLWLREVRDAGGAVQYLEGFVEDITARRRAEEELRDSEERYRLLFEMETDAIVLIEEATGRFVEVNRAATALYGYSREELLALRNVDVSAQPEETRERTLERAAYVPRRLHRRKDGSTFLCEIVARSLGWRGVLCQLVSIRDITARARAEEERQRLLEQLQRAQKLEALGRLAGGIAHDFNNLLMVVRTCADLLRACPPADGEAPRELEDLLAVADRGTALTRQLLAFARQEVLPAGSTDATGSLRALCGMLPRVLGARIAVSASVPDDLGRVPLTEAQLDQVLLNLAINARDAMPDGGRLTIQADRRAVASEPGGLKAGTYVRFEVRDTGTGMTPEVQARLFEPLFTTKPAGQGTGLGLSTSAGIVREVGGTMTVASAPGAGSCFSVWLPLLAAGSPPPR